MGAGGRTVEKIEDGAGDWDVLNEQTASSVLFAGGDGQGQQKARSEVLAKRMWDTSDTAA